MRNFLSQQRTPLDYTKDIWNANPSEQVRYADYIVATNINNVEFLEDQLFENEIPIEDGALNNLHN